LGYTSGFAFELGYSYCTGLNNFSTSLPTDSAGYTTTKTVSVNLLPAASLNLIVSYNWVFHNRNQFYINTGYAVPLQTSPYQVTDGSTLTADSKYTLSILSPGGIILSCGFMFAL